MYNLICEKKSRKFKPIVIQSKPLGTTDIGM